MRRAFLVLAAVALVGAAADQPAGKAKAGDKKSPEAGFSQHFKLEEHQALGSVTVAGKRIDYTVTAGNIVVHPRGWDDAMKPPEKGDKEASGGAKNPDAEASMFYVAYFKRGARADQRPVMFVFNGGPGSSTMWLHMGAFGPRRIVTSESAHTPAAPYSIVNNEGSLLDVTDLVFIDMPAAGFSRIAGEGKEKAFFGVDQDAYAFSEFIVQFLSKHGRWNSPKYLFGESYGTTRAAVLVNMLQGRAVDFNGIIMLAQILNFDLSPDGPEINPGVDLPYQLALPTYAATAWYHKKIPDAPAKLEDFLAEVERFAMGEYAMALSAGGGLETARRDAIAAKLSRYTGLPVDYIKKANLRINGGVFEQHVQGDPNVTTGRLDTRFTGPSIDPLSKEADYDPQAAAISSAYVTAYNDYVRRELKFGEGIAFRPNAYAIIGNDWDLAHQPPGAGGPIPLTPNVMPDLANAMKQNPNLKVMLNAGYYDLATPYFQGVYELKHLQIPPSLQANIEYKFYGSGHMIYAVETELKRLHDNVADFVRRTDNVSP